MNFENLGVAELSTEEMITTDGGDGGFTLLGAALVVGGALAVGLIVGGVAAYVVYKCVTD